jgi:hypothetical protein
MMEDQPNKEYSGIEPQGEWSVEGELEREPEMEEEQESESIIYDEMDDEDFKDEKKPAVVINVQSWAIPIVGIVMLLIGIAAGYAGRAIIASLPSGSAAVPEVTEVSSPESIVESIGVGAQIPTITPQQPSPADQEQLMAFLVSQTRHFKGEADAPVTIIEFSDFQ